MNEQLKIVISAEIDKLKKGCQDATKSIKDVGDSAEQTGSKSDSAFTKLGNAAKKAGAVAAKALAAGIAAASAAVVALGKSAIESYAEYEQLVGGVETLFKDSAGIVKGYAENAYKTAGLSANQYMETVTSFSASLLQSLGGDTVKAAEYADMAITDMSDNANKMGSTMESIQNAYQGFAKQNYTMLDNLKLGYGGTKEEMARLLADAEKISGIKYDISSYSDVIDAIHVMQVEMGIAGTTAEEAAKTISGSVAMTKSAWKNLVTGIADDNADFEKLIDNFVSSIDIAMQNILPRVEIALKGIGQLIEKLLPEIAVRIPQILINTVPQILQAGIAIVTALINGIVQSFPLLYETFATLIPQLGSTIQQNIPVVVQKIQELMASLGAKIEELLPTFVSKGLTMIAGLASNIKENLPKIVESGMDMIKSAVKGLMASLPELIAQAPLIISDLANSFSQSMQTIFGVGLEIIWEIIKGVVQAVPDLIMNIPQIIKAIVDVWMAYNWLNLGKNVITSIKTGWSNMIGGLKETASSGTKGVVESIKTQFNKVINAVKNPLETAKTAVKAAIDKMKSFFNFKWSLPKLSLPKISISGKFSLNPPSAPKFSINWNKLGGVFDKPTLFNYGGSLQGIGEDGAEAVVPLEKNTQWLDRLADRLTAKQNGIPIILQVDGKTFAQVSIDSINALTKQRGTLGLNLV